MSETKETQQIDQNPKKKGIGVTAKLVFAVVVSAMIAVSVLLGVVYNRMSQTLLEKSEELLHTTSDKTLQETKAWMTGRSRCWRRRGIRLSMRIWISLK